MKNVNTSKTLYTHISADYTIIQFPAAESIQKLEWQFRWEIWGKSKSLDPFRVQNGLVRIRRVVEG